VGDRLAMQGRWFTANEPDVDVYASEILATGAEPRTYYVDVPVAEAARYRVDADPVARRLARSPAHEYLLPSELVADKVPLLGEAATVDVAELEPVVSALTIEAPAPVLERDLGLDLEMAP